MDQRGGRGGGAPRLPFLSEIPELPGRRVTVMGLGLFGGGVAVTKALLAWGARVTVTDLRTSADLRESVEALRGSGAELHLGGHRDGDFRNADLVVVNPGVPPDSPHLRAAVEAGVPLESEMNLLLKRCRARCVVGVTGSNGKTTTTALIGEVLSRGKARVWVGGNIGRPLIGHADEMAPDDVVVLEISSFQLEHLGAIGRSPRVAVVMNLTPNHLDRHGTMEEYAAAKREIVAHQRAEDWKILNLDDPLVGAFEKASPSRTARFSLEQSPDPGASAAGDRIVLRDHGAETAIDVSRRRLPGRFNLQNMAAAALASHAAAEGWSGWRDACEEAFNAFPGVEHRLEFVGETGGARVYNDSIATNPESTIAALETLPGPVVLLAGGYDKKLPFDGLARSMKDRVRVLVLTGETSAAIEEAVRRELEAPPEILTAAGFDDAVRLARRQARAGETLLFSPACASYGQFRNFADRGRRFKEIMAGKP